MPYQLALTKANRLCLAEAFRDVRRVDYSIDCVIEGQMGRAFADNPAVPAALCISTGPFRYFAGDASSPGATVLVRSVEGGCLLMPSAPGWLDLARDTYGDNLVDFPRYSFSTESLSPEHLRRLLDGSRHRDVVVPLDASLVPSVMEQGEDFLKISDFDSPEDFEARGIGFATFDGDRVIGTAYSSLVCSKGIEVSLFVNERHRRQGVATAMACRLVLECLRRGLRPNWDAANPESCRIALKLGFTFAESYDAYYIAG